MSSFYYYINLSLCHLILLIVLMRSFFMYLVEIMIWDLYIKSQLIIIIIVISW